jgi:hypothetical protein
MAGVAAAEARLELRVITLSFRGACSAQLKARTSAIPIGMAGNLVRLHHIEIPGHAREMHACPGMTVWCYSAACFCPANVG